MGGAFVNDFNRFGKLYRVYVQAESESRLKSDDIGRIFVRSKTTNQMVPLSTLVTITDTGGTELTTRFNLLRSVEVQGSPARGYTSGQALAALEAVFNQTMPKEMSFSYSTLYWEKKAPPPAPTSMIVVVSPAGGDVRKLAITVGGLAWVATGSVGALGGVWCFSTTMFTCKSDSLC
jgi:HAE1 family hydrophobic/amphiphilic exporter-1